MSELSFEYFTKVAKEFSLGSLTTESFHPKTKDLSNHVKSDLSKAIDLLYSIDQDALIILETKLDEKINGKTEIKEVEKKDYKTFRDKYNG